MRSALIGVVVISRVLAAQTQPPSLTTIVARHTGDMVRVTTTTAPPIVGVLTRVQAETLFIQSARQPIASRVLASDVQRLDVREPLSSDARAHRGIIGSLIGTITGAGIGSALAVPVVHRNERNHAGPFEQGEYLIYPLVGALVGAEAGHLAGHLPSAPWRTAYAVTDKRPQ